MSTVTLDAAVIHLVLARRAGGFAVPTPEGPSIDTDHKGGVITFRDWGPFAARTAEQAKAELDLRWKHFGKRLGEVVFSDRIYAPLGSIR